MWKRRSFCIVTCADEDKRTEQSALDRRLNRLRHACLTAPKKRKEAARARRGPACQLFVQGLSPQHSSVV